jgi:hypothetical protein
MKLCDPLDITGGTESLETIDQNELIVLDTNNHGRELPVTLQGTRHGTFRIRIVKTISLQSFIDPFEIQQTRFIGLPIELPHDCLHAVELPTTRRKSLFPCSIPLEPVTPGASYVGQDRLCQQMVGYSALGAHRDHTNSSVYRW